MPLNNSLLIFERDRLLDYVTRFFSADPQIIGIFIGGSLAAETSDCYSDIDLRVVAKTERHDYYVAQRREIPKQWLGFLFNEWLPNAKHCVSHFQPFGKIDVFYLNAAELAPSPWYRLPIRILHDPEKIIAEAIKDSQELSFTVSDDDIDFSISKGIAAAHETYRRVQRGELFYTQSLLDELRQHIMHADDWLNNRTAETTVMAKFERRGSTAILTALKTSYCACEYETILEALHALTDIYRAMIIALHDKFKLVRPITLDLTALDIIQSPK